MTIPANAARIGRKLPSSSDKDAANQLRKLLASHVSGEARLKIVDAETSRPADVVLTPAVSDLLLELLRHIGRGDAVTLVPVGKMLTTQQAADILNVSRPFLISLIDRNEIGHVMAGRHRRIRADDLFEYKRRRDSARSDALSELARLDGENL